MKLLAVIAFLAAVSTSAFSSAQAQTKTENPPTVSELLNQGYDLKAASSNGQTQYIYLEGTAKTGRKQLYACQLQFGANGGFQGCLVLP